MKTNNLLVNHVTQKHFATRTAEEATQLIDVNVIISTHQEVLSFVKPALFPSSTSRFRFDLHYRLPTKNAYHWLIIDAIGTTLQS